MGDKREYGQTNKYRESIANIKIGSHAALPQPSYKQLFWRQVERRL